MMDRRHICWAAWTVLILAFLPASIGLAQSRIGQAPSNPPSSIQALDNHSSLAPSAITTEQDFQSSSPSDRVATSACVLLQNDQVIFGQAQQVGEFVVIRRGNTGEIRLPRREVACWAGSLRDLYQYRVDHRADGVLSSRVRDARWCMDHELNDLADVEISQILQRDPSNPEALRMRQRLRRRQLNVPSSVPVVQGIDTVNYEDSVDLSAVELQALRFFVSSVQPTLMNRCGNCHSHTSNRDWMLTMPPHGSRASSRMTRENMAAAMAFIEVDSPEQSPLLQRALTSHGDAKSPPLDARHTKAINALKHWIVASSQHKLPDANESAQSHLMQSSAKAETKIVQRAEVQKTAMQPSTNEDSATSVHPGSIPDESQPAQPKLSRPYLAERPDQADASDQQVPRSSLRMRVPARLPQVSNPFDPELFNRRHHRD